MGMDGEGSFRRLLQLCGSYFFFYVITGLSVKYFLGSPNQGFPGMDPVYFLVYSTFGGNLLCLLVIASRRWFHLPTRRYLRLGRWQFPEEFLYIVPSGICTAVVIPTTTLMYSLPISVMVAMVMMRGSVIVISRLVDALQIRQGILQRQVYREEDWAVVFALLAVAVDLFGGASHAAAHQFAFVHSKPALLVLGSYVLAYAIRIYIMNYYKNTRAKGGVTADNRAFFAIEQLAATVSLMSVALLIVCGVKYLGWRGAEVQKFHLALTSLRPHFGGALFAGAAFGAVAFFSVFIFMFKGRTATFAGLVNRLTSLCAGTAATVLFAWFGGGPRPALRDWLALLLILVAVLCLAIAEKRRSGGSRPRVAMVARNEELA